MSFRFESLFVIATIALLLCSGFLVGCSRDQAEESTPASVEVAQEGRAQEPPPVTAAAASAGSASFEVDGEGRDFGFLPADENYYGRMSSGVVAKPKAGASEQLRITFLSMDLRSQEIPGELPPADAGTTIANAMQMVGFSYMDAAGHEWAGPGRIYIESFGDDGTLVARFSSVSLPHTDDERPAITLANGSVTAKLD